MVPLVQHSHVIILALRELALLVISTPPNKHVKGCKKVCAFDCMCVQGNFTLKCKAGNTYCRPIYDFEHVLYVLHI